MREIITRTLSNFQHVNNVSQEERYYVAGYSGGALASIAVLNGVSPILVPLIVPYRARLDRIGIRVNVAAGGNARIGIYNTTSAVNLTPLDLVMDSGNIDITTTGLKVAVVNQVLEANTLYWVAAHSSTVPTINVMPAAICYPILGFENTFNIANTAGIGWSCTMAFGPFPYTLPTPSIISTTFLPAIAYRLAV